MSWSLIGRVPSLLNLRYLFDLEEPLEELVSTALKLVRPRDRYNCHYLQRAIAFVFVLSALKEGLVLSIVFPSGHSVQVSITDPSVDADAVPLVRDFQDRVFVSVPQAGKTIGPIRLDEYTAWKVARHKIAELDHLMGSIFDRKSLPPLR